MTHSLYYKFIIGYLVFGLLGFITIATISSDMTYDFLLETKSDALYDEANMLASDFSQLYRGRNSNLNEAAPRLKAAATYLQGEAWIVDTTGHIVADSSVPAKTDVTLSDFDPTFMGNRSYTIGNCFGVFPYEVLSVSAPITGNYNTYGYVLVHLPISAIQQIKDNILNILYISSGIIFGLSLIILLIFTVTVYFPLKKITIAANQYAEGNLKHKLQLKTHDEMGYLAATLNYMSDELDKMEEYQKTFIANVSHDFRSPLTSIKGYLEAMLDGTIPAELHEKYLRIVLNETERLTKLTGSLLTLNNLNTKGMMLNRSLFDINQVIRNTAASFEGTCKQKTIAIELTLTGDQLFVNGDVDKIQQVLYNLLDNAIEACVQTETRQIQVVIAEDPAAQMLELKLQNSKNSSQKLHANEAGIGYQTTKEDRGSHGYGTQIIQRIVDENGGTIRYVDAGDTMQITCRLCMEDKKLLSEG